MTQNDIHELLERIDNEPSVLLLGQKFLSTYTGLDPFLYQVSKEFAPKESPISVYSDLWSLFPSGLSRTECAKLALIRDKAKPQWWLRKILNKRWNIVYSSGVDGVITHGVGPNAEFALIPVQSTSFRREYIT